MMMRIMTVFLLAFTCVFLGCESEAAHEQRLKKEGEQKFAEEDEQRQDSMVHSDAVKALELQKQDELDRVEQRRTGDVYAHSCRKAVGINPGLPVAINTKGCTPEQLRLEQEAERKQMFDDAMKNSK